MESKTNKLGLLSVLIEHISFIEDLTNREFITNNTTILEYKQFLNYYASQIKKDCENQRIFIKDFYCGDKKIEIK